MKSFIRSIASSDERVLVITRLHWIYLLSGMLWFAGLSFIGFEAEDLLASWLGDSSGIQADFYFFSIDTSLAPVRWFFVLAGFVAFSSLFLTYISTEVGLTDRRFIYKTGLFMIEVEEIGFDDIRGEHVRHGVFGGIIGYGRIRIECRYVDSLDVPAIRNPHRFVRMLHALRAGRHHRTEEDGMEAAPAPMVRTEDWRGGLSSRENLPPAQNDARAPLGNRTESGASHPTESSSGINDAGFPHPRWYGGSRR